MSTYKEIIGKKIKKVTSDPSNSVDGQMWYNSTTGSIRGLAVLSAWSSGSPLITARYSTSGAGTQTAGLHIAGNVGPSDTRTALVEEYNGSGFSAGGALPTATRSGGSAGTQTAAFYAGGYATADVSSAYTYDGSSWTSIPSLGTARRSLNPAGAGTTTASIVCGGYASASPEGARAIVEEYNGSSWSEQNDLPAARANVAACGTQTALIIANGGPSAVNLSFLYDGTNWTAAPNTNATLTGRMGAGTQTAAIVVGGRPPTSNVTENYDGTSWTTNPATLATARYEGAPATSGTSSEWMISGGYSTAVSAATEEFTTSTNTITAAAWASGGSLGTARRQVGGFGHTTTTAVCVCGQNPPALSNVEEYDGSSWSEVNNAPIARVKPFACGVLTAGLIGGGESGPSPASYQSSAEYDGTNWTASPSSAIGQNAGDPTAFGIQTAALLVIGSQSPNTAVKYYDGSTWTAGPAATPTSMASASGNGTQTNGLVYGNSPSQTTTLEWDGSSWTSGGALNSGRDRGAEAVGAPSTAALYFGGNNPSSTELTATEGYDGTSWSSRPSMATARRGLGGAGVNTLSLAFGGYTGSDTAATEEFTGETTAANIKTFTTS